MSTISKQSQSVKEKQAEALSRAQFGKSWSNFPAIINGFMKRGISEKDIKPRENVFTYAAWKALGRQVRRGEKGVRVLTFIPCSKEEKNPETGEVKVKAYSTPRSVSVFHISQTDSIDNAGMAVAI